MENKCILEIDNLKIKYCTPENEVNAVKKINMKVYQDIDVGIMGESGCGKSTMALQILRLLDKNAVSEGKIIFEGIDICNASEKEMNDIRWKKISISFQNALEVLNPVMKIKEQISEGIKKHNKYLSYEEIKDRVNNLLDIVNLENKWGDAFPHQLSGGMRQKVLLAMALSCNPKLLILDEPTTALDAENKKLIIELIKRLKKELKFTLIVISHDLEVISQLSEKVYVMYSGLFMESGFTKDVLEDPYHTYTKGFLNSSPALFKYKDLWGIRRKLKEKYINENNGCPFILRCPQSTDSCTLIPEMKLVGNNRMVACHKGGVETLLSAKELSKTYDQNKNKVAALKNVSLNIKSGEVIAVLGKSGSGKSTLAHLLVSLEDADSGNVIFHNSKISNDNMSRKLNGVQIVLQDPVSATSRHMSNFDVVAEPLVINKIYSEEVLEEKVKRVLELVQLPYDKNFLDRKCSTLSGGQRQRLAIARALAMRPKILIADEITSMLDPSTQANLIREIKDIQNQHGFTMIFITHDLHMARKISDRVCIMENGRLIETGTAATIFDYPKEEITKKLFSNFHWER